MIKLKEFENKVINRFTDTITDRVFLLIQNDRELLQDYLDLLSNHKRNFINSDIAKAIKKRFDLDNKKLKNKQPESYLIKSFEEFNLK